MPIINIAATFFQSPVFYVLLVVAVLILAAVGAIIITGILRRRDARDLASAEERAKSIINEAIKSAEGKKREALLEAKEEIHKNRSDYEREVKERRAEITKQENRLRQKEESLDKKNDNLDKKTETLQKKIADADAVREEIEHLKQAQADMLEKVAGMTADEAKAVLLKTLETEVSHESAQKIMEYEQRFREESEAKARELITMAVQRVASDQVVEATVSVVPLPNDEMKGRIIGREGRNIRAIENLTGVDLIIDDTPEAITVSSFDPVRREVARITLEKLILDGRIHPTRIEECVAKAQREVDQTIKSEGERATFDTGVHGIHPELIKLLGRLHYRTSYGQNVLQHSIEVAHVAGVLAGELGVDVQTAKRAGLLHDIGKSIDHEVEGTHVSIGAETARKYKENEIVVHAIEAHHGDVEPKTLIAWLIQAADTLSAARPGARRENIESYVKRLEKLEELTKSFSGVESSFAIQAGREIRIVVHPEEVSEDQMVLLARDIARKIETELEYPGQIKVNLIRETKAVEYAR